MQHWEHLTGHSIQLITDPKYVLFMLNLQTKRKIKNDKICCWRLELPSYSFDIVFCPDEDNIVANTFSRVYCLAINTDAL